MFVLALIVVVIPGLFSRGHKPCRAGYAYVAREKQSQLNWLIITTRG